jgi:hypothetical protein
MTIRGRRGMTIEGLRPILLFSYDEAFRADWVIAEMS